MGNNYKKGAIGINPLKMTWTKQWLKPQNPIMGTLHRHLKKEQKLKKKPMLLILDNHSSHVIKLNAIVLSKGNGVVKVSVL